MKLENFMLIVKLENFMLFMKLQNFMLIMRLKNIMRILRLKNFMLIMRLENFMLMTAYDLQPHAPREKNRRGPSPNYPIITDCDCKTANSKLMNLRRKILFVDH